MKNHSNTSENLNRHNKDTQKERFYEYFKTNTTTVYQFEKATGISRANGCRFKKELENAGLLQVVKIGRCPASNFGYVQYITTDENKFRTPQQLNLFKQ